MKVKKVKNLVIQNLLLLLPLLLYGLFKNGYLIYARGLINIFALFKPLYLVIISFIIKLIFDLILYRKFTIDYNLLSIILVGMIMPYNINLIVYIITLTITYGLFLFINKKININPVCFMYLIIIIINSIFNTFTYQNILESTYNYSFSYVDYLMGRNIGGISSTSILFCLLTFSYLTYSIYYKKDIPLGINITYLILIFIYYFITKNNLYLINSELLFGSIFVSTIPMYSPYSKSKQIIYSIFIGIISFVITITFNSVISIYVATLIASLLMNIPLKKLIKR